MKQKNELAQEDYTQGMKYTELAEKYEISINILLSLGEKGMIGIEKGCTQMSKDERTNHLELTLQTDQSILGFVTGRVRWEEESS
ncbi:hypothetical protein ACWOMK_25765 [Bacillus thuringiensis]|nr:hypothetical protein [Bacillus thuringiensis]